MAHLGGQPAKQEKRTAAAHTYAKALRQIADDIDANASTLRIDGEVDIRNEVQQHTPLLHETTVVNGITGQRLVRIDVTLAYTDEVAAAAFNAEEARRNP